MEGGKTGQWSVCSTTEGVVFGGRKLSQAAGGKQKSMGRAWKVGDKRKETTCENGIMESTILFS